MMAQASPQGASFIAASDASAKEAGKAKRPEK